MNFSYSRKHLLLLLKVLLGISSLLLLFCNLNCKSLWGSEGRWAEVVRQMFLLGDFFHPRINGEPYFDKPLFSYWAIAFFVPLLGKLNEFVTRLPSALAGLGTLAATYYIGRKMWDKVSAILASFILLTSFGFLSWSRTAAADMENLFFIAVAICWYIRFRHTNTFLTYLGFYTICSIGAHFKGLTAIAVPFILVLCHLLIYKEWNRHLNAKNLIAFASGVVIYILPFAYAEVTSQHYSQQGLYLAFRENIIRFFKAFDHKDPIYVYFYYVPFLMLPWVFLLAGYLVDRIKGYIQMDKNDKWLLMSFVAIFLLFTISSSRRSYYILPILPFGALGIATFLSRPFDNKIRGFFFMLQAAFLLAISTLGILNLFLWPLVTKLSGYVPPAPLPYFVALWSVIAFLFAGASLLVKNEASNNSFLIRSTLIIFSAIAIFTGLFCNWECYLEKDRPLKPFVQELRPLIKNIPTNSIALSKNMASVAFYLDRKNPLVNLERKENIISFLKQKGVKVVISRKKDMKHLLPYLEKCNMTPLLSSISPKWDRRADKRLEAWTIKGVCTNKNGNK